MRVGIPQDVGNAPKRELGGCALSPNEGNGSAGRTPAEWAYVEASASGFGLHRQPLDQRDARAARDHLNERRQASRAELSNACAAASCESLLAEAVPVVEEGANPVHVDRSP